MKMEHNQNIYKEKLKTSASASKGLLFSTLLTLTIFIIELIGGFISGSLALIADAGHMATDVFALSISYFAVWMSNKPATNHRTYGYYRVEILAALANGLLLVGIAGLIAFEAVARIGSPKEIQTTEMIFFGLIGFAANLASACLLHRAKSCSVNVKSAYLHVLSDLAGSVGVLIGAGLIALTKWLFIDSLVSLFIAILIVRSGWQIVSEAIDVLLESVPREIDLTQIEGQLRAHRHVVDLHDLHVWAITSGVNALSCHIVIDEYDCSQSLILSINQMLKERFNIDHVTIQLENGHVHKHIQHVAIEESAELRFAREETHRH
jgi:cobalt-zinc-cadmium efflux system protein